MHVDSKEIFMLREDIHRSCDRRAVTEKVICMRAREPADISLNLSYSVLSIKCLRWGDCIQQSVNLSEFLYWNTNCLQWPVRDGQGKWFTHLVPVEGRSDKIQKMWRLRLVKLRCSWEFWQIGTSRRSSCSICHQVTQTHLGQLFWKVFLPRKVIKHWKKCPGRLGSLSPWRYPKFNECDPKQHGLTLKLDQIWNWPRLEAVGACTQGNPEVLSNLSFSVIPSSKKQSKWIHGLQSSVTGTWGLKEMLVAAKRKIGGLLEGCGWAAAFRNVEFKAAARHAKQMTKGRKWLETKKMHCLKNKTLFLTDYSSWAVFPGYTAGDF